MYKSGSKALAAFRKGKGVPGPFRGMDWHSSTRGLIGFPAAPPQAFFPMIENQWASRVPVSRSRRAGWCSSPFAGYMPNRVPRRRPGARKAAQVPSLLKMAVFGDSPRTGTGGTTQYTGGPPRLRGSAVRRTYVPPRHAPAGARGSAPARSSDARHYPAPARSAARLRATHRRMPVYSPTGEQSCSPPTFWRHGRALFSEETPFPRSLEARTYGLLEAAGWQPGKSSKNAHGPAHAGTGSSPVILPRNGRQTSLRSGGAVHLMRHITPMHRLGGSGRAG